MSVNEEDLCHHMKVVVRVRPENTKEKAAGFHKVAHVVDKHILVFDPKQQEISFFRGKKSGNRDITKKQNKDLKFVFDAVFDETSTQLEVFEHTTKPILRSFLNGYNCTGNYFSWGLIFLSDFSFYIEETSTWVFSS